MRPPPRRFVVRPSRARRAAPCAFSIAGKRSKRGRSASLASSPVRALADSLGRQFSAGALLSAALRRGKSGSLRVSRRGRRLAHPEASRDSIDSGGPTARVPEEPARKPGGNALISEAHILPVGAFSGKSLARRQDFFFGNRKKFRAALLLLNPPSGAVRYR